MNAEIPFDGVVHCQKGETVMSYADRNPVSRPTTDLSDSGFSRPPDPRDFLTISPAVVTPCTLAGPQLDFRDLLTVIPPVLRSAHGNKGGWNPGQFGLCCCGSQTVAAIQIEIRPGKAQEGEMGVHCFPFSKAKGNSD